MSKKLNSMPDYQARMPRFQHDLSQSLAFTSSTGMLLPVYYHPLHLGDRLRYQGNLSARLNPIVKPTVGSIDLHVDYFFVPLSVIYLPALNLFYQTDDLVSGLFNQIGYQSEGTDYYLDNTRFPLLDVSGSLHQIATAGVNGAQVFNGITYPSSSFDVKGKAAFRLCDLLDFNPADLFSTTQSYNPSCTPWFLCAYHAIYENYAGYRNSDREKRSYLYSLDTFYSYPNAFTNSELFALHYVDAYKDYFNSIKVSPVGASVSMLGSLSGQSNPWDLLSKVNSYLWDGSSYLRSPSVIPGTNNDFNFTTVRGYNAGGSNFNTNFTSANIRQLFMVDKLLRVVGRADKNYEAQFLAHFGVEIPHDVLHNITHLGHDMFELNPSPTISTADTFDSSSQSGSSLGEVGGQGYVRGDGRLRHFEAPCHGIFMAIYHAKPRFRYYAGVSKLHDLSSPDKWWNPEFDRRGMQPVFSYEVIRFLGLYDFSSLTERLGWQFAYEQFKRKYDKVSRAFASMGSYNVAPPANNSFAPWFLSKVPFFTTSLSSFVPVSGETSPQIFTSNDYNFLSFKTLATDLNITMEVPYEPTWITDLTYANAHSLFYTDPLIIDYRMNCKISNFMSEYGEPELGD